MWYSHVLRHIHIIFAFSLYCSVFTQDHSLVYSILGVYLFTLIIPKQCHTENMNTNCFYSNVIVSINQVMYIISYYIEDFILVFINVQVKLKIALIIREVKKLYSLTSTINIIRSHLIRRYMETMEISVMWSRAYLLK